jgi:hypothetical protein
MTKEKPSKQYQKVVEIRRSGAAGSHPDKRNRRRRTRNASNRDAIDKSYNGG